jgi:hypothetical protein
LALSIAGLATSRGARESGMAPLAIGYILPSSQQSFKERSTNLANSAWRLGVIF